jgi:protein-S-isoprenylcysteine O-methyltransferase Ste14
VSKKKQKAKNPSDMQARKDSPGVYVPPPLIYAAIFLLSLLLQRWLAVNPSFFKTGASVIAGIVFIAIGLFFNIPAISKFIKTKNSLVTIKPAHSLQTSGIYSISRNPMYVSLLLFYTGLAFLIGNWWTVLLIPVVAWIITRFVIMAEERYLERAFGKNFTDYRERVRRWI